MGVGGFRHADEHLMQPTTRPQTRGTPTRNLTSQNEKMGVDGDGN